MKVLAIIFGLICVMLAVFAQATGFNKGMDGAVYHYIFWAFFGGVATAAGVLMR